jgi:RNA polymerase sigma factor (sigma-70 family)
VDRFRAQGRRPEVPTDEPADVVVEIFRESRGTSFGAIQARVVDQALGLLSPSDREVFQLRFLEDLPSTEVAARLGITVNTVDQRARRARTRLREALAARPALLNELAAGHPKVY